MMIKEVAIIIPAADEQDHIAECLDAIFRADDRLRRGPGRQTIRTQIILVLDACSDGTPAIASRYTNVVSIATDGRNVGAARQRGTELALKTICCPANAWLANTDADSVVPDNWLTHMVTAAHESFDVVLGTVQPGRGLTLTTEQTWYERHQLADGHPHVHGANFGIRASTYLETGGWQPYPSGEDVDLAQRANEIGASIQRTAAIPVTTSSREHGRAPYGFSSYLRQLAVMKPRRCLAAAAAFPESNEVDVLAAGAPTRSISSDVR
jgi:glycosyltransferase involved in cell wall biosynthesis